VDGLQGDVLSCDHTRRNAPQVIELVNQVMLEAQQQGDSVDFRAHSTESTALGGIVKLPRIDRAAVARASVQDSQWRDSLQTPRVIAEETGKTLECRQAARWVRQLLADPVLGCKPRDILVLARKRERLGLMQAELAALGIAALQPEKNDLADMPEVQDVIALLDALVSSRHNLSLAQALKSPIFGLDDSLLVEIAQRVRALQARRAAAEQESQGVYWMQILLESGELPVALQEVGVKLQRWKQWVASLPPHDALHAIYTDGDVLARYAAAVPAQRCEAVLANLQATLMAALELDGGRYASP
jgi:ATP-dependent helicase/nuclease subunit A